MGKISRHNLSNIIFKYNIKVFIETGTWKGDGINAAIRHPFEKIMSIDISPKHFESNSSMFGGDKRVKLFIGDSGIKLKEMLSEVGQNEPILFWLDAHLPDLNGKEISLAEEVIIPLERELKIIKEMRDISKDVFIIDDLRLFEYVDYPGFTNCWKPDTKRNANFIFDFFKNTHKTERDLRDEGYILVFPR